MSEQDEKERADDSTVGREEEFDNYGSNGGSSQWSQRVLTKDGVRDRTVSRDRKPTSGDENPHRK